MSELVLPFLGHGTIPSDMHHLNSDLCESIGISLQRYSKSFRNPINTFDFKKSECISRIACVARCVDVVFEVKG